MDPEFIKPTIPILGCTQKLGVGFECESQSLYICEDGGDSLPNDNVSLFQFKTTCGRVLWKCTNDGRKAEFVFSPFYTGEEELFCDALNSFNTVYGNIINCLEGSSQSRTDEGRTLKRMLVKRSNINQLFLNSNHETEKYTFQYNFETLSNQENLVKRYFYFEKPMCAQPFFHMANFKNQYTFSLDIAYLKDFLTGIGKNDILVEEGGRLNNTYTKHNPPENSHVSKLQTLQKKRISSLISFFAGTIINYSKLRVAPAGGSSDEVSKLKNYLSIVERGGEIHARRAQPFLSRKNFLTLAKEILPDEKSRKTVFFGGQCFPKEEDFNKAVACFHELFYGFYQKPDKNVNFQYVDNQYAESLKENPLPVIACFMPYCNGITADSKNCYKEYPSHLKLMFLSEDHQKQVNGQLDLVLSTGSDNMHPLWYDLGKGLMENDSKCIIAVENRRTPTVPKNITEDKPANINDMTQKMLQQFKALNSVYNEVVSK